MIIGTLLLLSQTWASSPGTRLVQLGWAAAVGILTIFTGTTALLYNLAPHRYDAATFLRRCTWQNILMSGLWGSYAFLVPHLPEPAVARMVHGIILSASSAGGIAAFTMRKRMAMAFMVPMWAVDATALLAQRQWALAGGAVCYVAIMVRFAVTVSDNLIEAIEVRHREADMAEQLRRSEQRARSVIDTAIEAVWSTDGRGCISDVNPAGSALIGLAREQVAGRFIGQFLPVAGAWLLAGEYPVTSFEDTLLSGRGHIRSMMVSLSLVDASGDGFITVMGRDISDRKALEDRLAYEANHDGLTGLPNRIGFFRRAETAVDACRAIDEEVAVLFVDLDRFKQVNDTLGHAAGDDLLLQASKRLMAELRDGDLVARLGGDEFVLLLPRPPASKQLTEFGHRLIASLERPFVLGTDEARISASIGIASVRARTTRADTLVARADMAMYRAKQSGRRQVVLYDDELQQRVDEHGHLEQAFRRALERRELEPWLQPIVELSTGAVVGAEVLTRWRRPGVGIVTPDVFIPLAHEAGLTADLGRWVLDRAADLLEDWTTEDRLCDLYVSVNVSGRHLLTGSVADEIDRKLIQRCIDPGKLLVELTETDLAVDLDEAHDALRAIRRLGADVAIDDFGTGYSSLAYLQELPASTLKIDRRFVSTVTDDERQATLVKAVIELSNAFGLNVVAEGIETPEQAEIISRLGGQYGQGFLFGRPMPAEQFERLVAEQTCRPSTRRSDRRGQPASSAATSSSSNAMLNASMLPSRSSDPVSTWRVRATGPSIASQA